MSKNIKCSHCKYLEPRPSVIDPDDPPKEEEFICEADKNLVLIRSEISNLRDCTFYRSRTETAWQEVRKDIAKKTPGLLEKILGIFKK